jgi:uncharacterized RDD family membrane protein YckC
MTEASAPAAASAGVMPATPGTLRRLAAMAYELLLLVGVLFASTCLFLIVTQSLDEQWRRPLLQITEFIVCGIYFIWLWRHGGQTLAMKTWRVRLVSVNGGAVSMRSALARYMLAWILIPLGGIGIWWALVDPDRQFLYDRLAGTRLVRQDS